MIMNMQNGLHLVIYEVAKPIIIKNYCENIDKPVLKCDGKCHLRKVLTADASTESDNQPANIPPPQIKFNTVTYFFSTIDKLEISLQGFDLISFDDFVFNHSKNITSRIFRPPITVV